MTICPLFPDYEGTDDRYELYVYRHEIINAKLQWSKIGVRRDPENIDESELFEICDGWGEVKANLRGWWTVQEGDKPMKTQTGTRREKRFQFATKPSRLLDEDEEESTPSDKIEYADQVVQRVMTITNESMKQMRDLSALHMRETLHMMKTLDAERERSHAHHLETLTIINNAARENERNMITEFLVQKNPQDTSKLISAASRAVIPFLPVVEAYFDRESDKSTFERVVESLTKLFDPETISAVSDTLVDVVMDKVAGRERDEADINGEEPAG